LPGKVIVELGLVMSIRICALPVLTDSEFPTLSTEKYWIVYTPSALRVMSVPCGEAVVGVEPFVV
jgi:hypothetical protein